MVVKYVASFFPYIDKVLMIQIKNSVRTAQALALYENTPLSMDHIKRVLEVAETFDQDLRGGTGYLDAMRSYT